MSYTGKVIVGPYDRVIYNPRYKNYMMCIENKKRSKNPLKVIKNDVGKIDEWNKQMMTYSGYKPKGNNSLMEIKYDIWCLWFKKIFV